MTKTKDTLEVPPRPPDPAQPAKVRMLESVQLNTLGLTAMKGAERELPRGQAVSWYLLGCCEPAGWTPEREELSAAAPAALAHLDMERGGRGCTEEQWVSIPHVRRRYERLFSLLDGAGLEGGDAA